MSFKYAMTLKEMRRRTSKTYFKGIKFLSETDREVKRLSKEDLLVLMHLTRAAKLMDQVNLKLGHPQNLEFLEFLNKGEAEGDERAVLAKKMFLAQKSMFSPDTLGNQTVLAKDVKKLDGMGYFPADLEVEEFHKILSEMLDAGKVKEVAEILNQRTIVVRDGNWLKAIDFVDAFVEFKEMAEELEKAREYVTDKKFNKYLELQIKAFLKADPKLDAKADIAWAKLDRSKFEFTITRECYDEALTKSIYENEELLNKLKANGIVAYTKDSLGARVGVVNKTGTKLLKKLKDLVKVSAKCMPYLDEYEQVINAESDGVSQVAVDVDLVTLTGEEGAYQAGIVLAQNLPNDDKLALAMGGGRRNVYHRQIRKKSNKKLYKALICEEQFKFYNPEADHWAVICHENTHSLGPKSHNVLGKYSAILEEYKADMGMYAFLDEFEKAGYFNENQIRQIMVTSLSKSFPKGKPNYDQPHRVRAVMICNRMLTEGAIKFENEKLVFDFDKVIKTAKTMMAEVVRLQLDANVKKAGDYVDKWFVWSKEIEAIAEIIKKYSKALNGYIITPLADEFLKPDYESRLLAE